MSIEYQTRTSPNELPSAVNIGTLALMPYQAGPMSPLGERQPIVGIAQDPNLTGYEDAKVKSKPNINLIDGLEMPSGRDPSKNGGYNACFIGNEMLVRVEGIEPENELSEVALYYYNTRQLVKEFPVIDKAQDPYNLGHFPGVGNLFGCVRIEVDPKTGKIIGYHDEVFVYQDNISDYQLLWRGPDGMKDTRAVPIPDSDGKILVLARPQGGPVCRAGVIMYFTVNGVSQIAPALAAVKNAVERSKKQQNDGIVLKNMPLHEHTISVPHGEHEEGNVDEIVGFHVETLVQTTVTPSTPRNVAEQTKNQPTNSTMLWGKPLEEWVIPGLVANPQEGHPPHWVGPNQIYPIPGHPDLFFVLAHDAQFLEYSSDGRTSDARQYVAIGFVFNIKSGEVVVPPTVLLTARHQPYFTKKPPKTPTLRGGVAFAGGARPTKRRGWAKLIGGLNDAGIFDAETEMPPELAPYWGLIHDAHQSPRASRARQPAKSKSKKR